MSAAAFDTLSTARKLEAAGVERRQAEAHAEALREAVREAVSADREALATKADLDAKLAALETRLRADLATKADLETLRSEMRWMLAFQAALILAIAAKLFGIV